MEYHKELFNRYNETHGAYLDGPDAEKMAWFDFYFETVYKHYFKEIPHDATIAELGCNKGYLLATLARRGYTQLSGVDLSPDDVVIARHRVPQATVVCDDAITYLQNNKNSFDCIILKALIEHIKKDQLFPFLQAIHGALKKGGIVFIDVQNSDWLFGLHDRYVDFTHELGFTPESLGQVLRIFFANVQVTPTESPVWQMGRRDTIKHAIAKKIVFTLLQWAQPEASCSSKRLLIARAVKQE